MIWKKTPPAAPTNSSQQTPSAASSPVAAAATAPNPAGLHKVEFNRPASAAVPPPVSKPDTPEISPDDLRQKAAAAKAISATFGEIVSLLMRSKDHRHWSLAEVEQIVVPALLAGQVSVATAQSKANGLVTPAGFVLWAQVSEEVDKRLSANPGQATKLAPQDWKSGDIVWIVLALGDRRVLDGQLQTLQQRWGNRVAKVLVKSGDGNLSVGTIPSRVA